MPEIVYNGKRDGVDVWLPSGRRTFTRGEPVTVTADEAKRLAAVEGFSKPRKKAAKKAATKKGAS